MAEPDSGGVVHEYAGVRRKTPDGTGLKMM